jgi:hypothetical protein
VRGGERHVHVAAFADGLAAVHAFDDGELAGLLLQQPRDAVDVLGAFGRGHLAPHCVVGLACGFHGGVHIGLVGLGDARDLLLVGGVDGVEVLAALGLHPLAVDEELVLGVDLDVVLGLGCGGEGPVEGVLLGGHGFKDRLVALKLHLGIKLGLTALDRDNFKKKYRQRMAALVAGVVFWVVLLKAII